ncbi:hypothetical protein GYMLUDRAFT_38985 [Collybiopsis luxurians FD-317 M1]|nr:hypothetical protein GYMLUDRAFT_38985 [Collybiopsis luxurians FD-317 M1]
MDVDEQMGVGQSEKRREQDFKDSEPELEMKDELGSSSIITGEKNEKKKKKKKEKQKDPSEVAPSSEGKERKKKRKRDEEPLAEPETERTDPAEVEIEPKKKKSKNKTGFPDPAEETLLSEQARKALVYAFTQFRKPSKWKFQKARQNWIIRNIWSAENIPDSQMPLVLKYLSNVQGNVRETLIKTCESIIEKASNGASESPASDGSGKKEPEQSEGKASEQPEEARSMKTLRAEALLAVLKNETQV